MAKLKLTEELINELCKFKRAGLTNKSVCYAANISERSFYEYLNRGEADSQAKKKTIYSRFFQSYKKAEAQHKLKRLRQIEAAADRGSWQAAAWELERCYPDEYGKRIAAEVSGKNGGAIKTETELSGSVKTDVDLSLLTDEELERLEQIVGKIAKD